MYKTSDLSIAAYLMMKGMKLANAYRSQNGQFMFEFEDLDNVCKSNDPQQYVRICWDSN